MSRSLGLGIENVLSFRAVLYNGTLITTNATNHPELFFALRGAGSGNYGVITAMEYKFLHPMPKRQLASQMEIPSLILLVSYTN
jgi:FAD/FMN-containing dehydrogenase